MIKKTQIKNKLSNIIKKPYYYISPCPKCQSKMTGRYIQEHMEYDTQWAIDESLKNGEIVSAVPEIPYKNAFCLNCNYEWEEEARLKLLSLKEINEERIARCTNELYKAIHPPKESAEETEKKKNKNMISKFIGHI